MLHKVIIVAQMLHVLTQKNNFPLKIYEIILNEWRINLLTMITIV